MHKLIAFGLGTCLGMAGVLSGCSDGSNLATTSTAGGSGAGGTTNSSNIGGGAQGGNTALASTFTPGTGPVAIDSLAHELGIVFCNWMSRCLGPVPLYYRGVVTNCVNSLEQTFTDQIVSQLKAAIARGTVVYDASTVRTCLDSLGQIACDSSNAQELPSKCATIWAGGVTIGGTCFSDVECAADTLGTYCASDGSCPGHCQVRAAQGQSCKSTSECQQNLECDTAHGVCVSQLKQGAPCVDGDETTGACGGFTRCKADTTSTQYHCSFLFDSMSVGDGQICDSLNLCADPLVCMGTGEVTDASSAANVYRCQQPVASGGACRYGIVNPCPVGEFCPVQYGDTTTSTAHCTPQIAANQTCNGTYAYECQDTGRCSSTSKKCLAPQHIGGPCENSDDCYSNVCTNSICVAPQDCSR